MDAHDLQAIGRRLARDARRIPVQASFELLDEWGILDQVRNLDVSSQFELFVLNLSAAVDATILFGADGLVVQAAMIEAAPKLAREIFDDARQSVPETTEVRQRIEAILSDYWDLGHAGTSEAEAGRYYALAADRVFGDLSEEVPELTGILMGHRLIAMGEAHALLSLTLGRAK